MTLEPNTGAPEGRGTTVLGMGPSTRQGPDPKLGDTKLPVDSQMSPATRGPAASSAAEPPRAAPAASTLPLGEPAKALSGIDFGALDFDLGPTKSGIDGAPMLPPVA